MLTFVLVVAALMGLVILAAIYLPRKTQEETFLGYWQRVLGLAPSVPTVELVPFSDADMAATFDTTVTAEALAASIAKTQAADQVISITEAPATDAVYDIPASAEIVEPVSPAPVEVPEDPEVPTEEAPVAAKTPRAPRKPKAVE
jgi:hypothetical protein